MDKLEETCFWLLFFLKQDSSLFPEQVPLPTPYWMYLGILETIVPQVLAKQFTKQTQHEVSALFSFPCCFSPINFYCPWRAWRLSPLPLLVGHFLGRLMVFQRHSSWCFQSCPSLKLESHAEIPVDEIMALLSHHTSSPRPQSSSAGATSHKIHWKQVSFSHPDLSPRQLQ